MSQETLPEGAPCDDDRRESALRENALRESALDASALPEIPSPESSLTETPSTETRPAESSSAETRSTETRSAESSSTKTPSTETPSPEGSSPENALRESEDKFRRVFDLVPYSMVIRDTAGRILDANARYCAACGVPLSEVVHRSASDFFDMYRAGDSRQRIDIDAPFILEAVKGPIELVAIHRATGRRRDVLFSAASITQRGEPCFVTFAFDITELRDVDQQFRQAQKMEAIGRLASGVAHDFNNLLTVISGYTKMALAQHPDEKLQRYLAEVRGAALRAESLTGQLLAFCRNQSLKPAVTDLAGLLRDTEALLHRLVGEDVELAVDLAPDLPPVCVDSGQLVQVLMNLAVNARDAMPQAGRIEIQTALVDLPEQRNPAQRLKPGPHIALRVTDNGTGMDDETLTRIFEPFFTTKPEGQGTGLGLSTVYGIVQQSGGSITARSRVGVGSVFEILLPAAESTVEPIPEPHETAAAAPAIETVLVVEDDDSLRSYVTEVLEDAGYLVLEASSGTEAIFVSEAHSEPIHLLIADMTLPGLDGREVVRRILAQRRGIAVIYMSGYAGGGVLEELLADETAVYLQKPFLPDAMLTYVKRALATRRAEKKSASAPD